MYLNLVLIEFFIYNEIKHNDYYNSLNTQTDFKYNYISKYI